MKRTNLTTRSTYNVLLHQLECTDSIQYSKRFFNFPEIFQKFPTYSIFWFQILGVELKDKN